MVQTNLQVIMMQEHIPEIVAVVAASIGTVIGVLHKLGFITFGKIKPPGNCDDCYKLSFKQHQNDKSKCPDHDEFMRQFAIVHDNQIANMQLHQQHTKDLANGKSDFKEIRLELKKLSIGMGILLVKAGKDPREIDRS